MSKLDERIAEYVRLTEASGQQAPRFSLQEHATAPNGKVHAEQLAFMRDRSHRTHVMCARQCGKTEGDNGILMEGGLFRAQSTNIFLGLNGPQVRSTNFEPKWKRMFDRYSGLDRDWMRERMVTYFPNGARVFMGGSDDAAHLKNLLGGTIDNGVFIVDECFPAGTLVDGRPIETIKPGDEVSAVDHSTGRMVNRRVVRAMEKNAHELVTVRTEQGSVICTATHPIFAKGKGYVDAKELRPGDLLCVRKALRADLSESDKKNVLEGMQGRFHAEADYGQQMAYAGGERPAVRQGKGESVYGNSGGEGESESNADPDWPQASDSGRQRTRSDASRKDAGRCPGGAMETWSRHTDEDGARVRVSELLQAGSGGRVDDDVYRGRWSEPSEIRSEGAGRQEGGALAWARVESVSRHEQGSPRGTAVYNLEVEGAHTYFANGVLVHNCQDQRNLDDLLDNILPPMMGKNARLVLSGVFPEVPAGRFWRESGWQERAGQWVQERKGGWSTHNWGRLANVHLADSWEVLQRYLKDTGKSINDPDIIRDWMGLPAFDPNATTYKYLASRNGYRAVAPDWLLMAYASQKDERGRALKYCHPMRPDKNGVLHGMMASMPLVGVRIFCLALDPGSASDRASIQGFGFGDGFRGVQHLFDWTSARKAFCSTGDMFAVLGLAYRAFLRWGEALNPHYDAGSSTNTIDNLEGDYGVPLVLAAKKADMRGQIDRFNDLLTESKMSVMEGSAMEQDLVRARRNKAAAERQEWAWDRAHHPDASEAGRYAVADYFDADIPKQPGPPAPYGYQEPFAAKQPQVSYNQFDRSTGESYGGGNALSDPTRGGGGGYGGAWNP